MHTRPPPLSPMAGASAPVVPVPTPNAGPKHTVPFWLAGVRGPRGTFSREAPAAHWRLRASLPRSMPLTGTVPAPVVDAGWSVRRSRIDLQPRSRRPRSPSSTDRPRWDLLGLPTRAAPNILLRRVDFGRSGAQRPPAPARPRPRHGPRPAGYMSPRREAARRPRRMQRGSSPPADAPPAPAGGAAAPAPSSSPSSLLLLRRGGHHLACPCTSRPCWTSRRPRSGARGMLPPASVSTAAEARSPWYVLLRRFSSLQWVSPFPAIERDSRSLKTYC